MRGEAIGGGASTDAPDAAGATDAAGAAGADAGAAEPAESAARSRSAGSADAAPGVRRERLQALAGASVRGSDDESVGRVRDIYLHDASGELAAITVVRRQLSSRTVLIPAAAIAALPAEHVADSAVPDAARETSDQAADQAAGDGEGDLPSEPGHPQALWLLVDAETALAGIRPPGTSHATPEMLREAELALGLQEASAG